MREPIWIEPEHVVVLHDSMLRSFSGHPGYPHPHYLESAVAAPRQLFAYQPDCDLYDLAGAYLWHIANAHAFIDGNKRSGYASALAFLSANGVWLFEPQNVTALAEVAVAAAAHEKTGVKREDVARFIRGLSRQKYRAARERPGIWKAVAPPHVRGCGGEQPWRRKR